MNEGVISSGDVYTVNQLKLRLGLTDSAYRAMKRQGLPVIRIGKRHFVSGRQIIEFMEGLFSDGNASKCDQGGG